MAFPLELFGNAMHKSSTTIWHGKTFTFPSARTLGEQPHIPPESLFQSLIPPTSPKGKEVSISAPNTLPSVAECATHLELLEAFLVMKQKVLTSNRLDRAFSIIPRDKLITPKSYRWNKNPLRYREKDTTWANRRPMKWTIYVGLATARFLKWAVAFSIYIEKGAPLEINDETLPPLDVLMVWHSFFLNPRDYKLFCMTHRMKDTLLKVKVPWGSIHKAISHSKRDFDLNPAASTLFETLTGEKADLFLSLADHKSHSESLRESYTELASSLFDNSIISRGYNSTHTGTAPEWSTFTKFLSGRTSLPNLSLSKEDLKIAHDLFNAVHRQADFVQKMCSKLWIRSPALEGTMRRAIIRYDRFLCLFKKDTTAVLVPTLDIDLVWHTHQCSPLSYEEIVKEKAGRFINHNDKLDKPVLGDGFKVTREFYEEEWKEQYDICTCWNCEALKSAVENVEWNADMEGLAKKVGIDVEFHKQAETARRAGRILPVNEPRFSPS